MKAKVVFDADGTNTKSFEGHLITTQIFPDGRFILRVLTKKGKIKHVLHVAKVYYVERWG